MHHQRPQLLSPWKWVRQHNLGFFFHMTIFVVRKLTRKPFGSILTNAFFLVWFSCLSECLVLLFCPIPFRISWPFDDNTAMHSKAASWLSQIMNKRLQLLSLSPFCTAQADKVCLLFLISDPPRSSPSIMATAGQLHSTGQKNNSYVVLPDSSVQLTCAGTGQKSHLQYAWYRLLPERQYVTNNTVLTLHNLTHDQDNTYVCQLTDPRITTASRSSESAIALNVFGKTLYFYRRLIFNLNHSQISHENEREHKTFKS